ncbi:MAG: thiamine pyrophosphate-binding protein [Dehalococcoidia bacterium]|nr:thiamine pyrophosphate-binding protein [Dehalococcoidia bacterium]
MTDDSKPMNGAQGVARALCEMGIELVTGMPGGHTGAIYDALYDRQDETRVLLVREESTGSAMAEAYGRLTGKPAVVMGQGAWVLTNAGAGIVEALMGSSPMIILVDFTEGGAFAHHGPYQSGLGHYGSFDAQRGFEAITKRTFVARDPVQAVQLTQLAYKHAMTGAPGPVAVLFESQALSKRIDPDARPPIHWGASYIAPANQLPAEALLDSAARAVRSASRPVVIAGNGVRLSQAEAELLAFAESLDIPVATTAAGKSVFPEDHPLSAGVVGTFGNDWANAVMGDADLVIAAGTRLSASDLVNDSPKLLDPVRQVLVQIDVDPLNASWTQPAAHALVGDARQTLAALRTRLEEASGGGTERVAAARKALGFATAHVEAGGSPVRARGAVAVLSDALPGDAIVTCDAGENRLFMLHDFRANGRRRFLQPNATGGMGYAVPAALGAKFAFPSAPVFAVCGDGGFAMTMHGLMTAIEERLPIVTVVLNNQALGWVYHGQGNRQIASAFAPFDHAAIATAIGCPAWRATNEAELRAAIPEALATGKPAVIEVMTTLEDTFQDVVSALGRGG